MDCPNLLKQNFSDAQGSDSMLSVTFLERKVIFYIEAKETFCQGAAHACCREAALKLGHR